MPTLIIPKSYQDNNVLREQDLDNIRNALLTFFNIIRLDETNLQLTSIINSLTPTQANILLNKVDSTGVGTLLNKVSGATAKAFYAKSEIYDTTSNQLSTATTVTTSLVTRLTYTFPASGIYLVTYGLTLRTPNHFCTVWLRNNNLGWGPSIIVDTSNDQTVGVSASSSSFTVVLQGAAGTDLTLSISRDSNVSANASTDVFMSTVRLA